MQSKLISYSDKGIHISLIKELKESLEKLSNPKFTWFDLSVWEFCSMTMIYGTDDYTSEQINDRNRDITQIKIYLKEVEEIYNFLLKNKLNFT